MSSRPSISNRSSTGMEMMQSPMFQRAVDRLANYKCLQAIRAGKLRVVQPPTSDAPVKFTPRMDLVDDPTTNNQIAIFELPGVKTADITLQIRNGNLVISGERRAPQAVQNALANTTRASLSLPRNPISAADSLAAGEMDTSTDGTDSNSNSTSSPSLATHELRFGQFYRVVSVPSGIKESDVTAALQDGMLTVTWPKVLGRTSQITPPVSPSTSANAAQ